MNNILLLIVVFLMCLVGVGVINYIFVVDGDWNNFNNWSLVGVFNVINIVVWFGDNVMIDYVISYMGNLKIVK